MKSLLYLRILLVLLANVVAYPSAAGFNLGLPPGSPMPGWHLSPSGSPHRHYPERPGIKVFSKLAHALDTIINPSGSAKKVVISNGEQGIEMGPPSGEVLRVNGIARMDSGFQLKAASDSLSFISIHRDIKNVSQQTTISDTPYTTTPTGWANGKNLPAFRLRHPSKQDFMILPYQYGTAIEYNGVVECWVGEWSIHRGLNYHDVENKGDGWGAVFWVGDDNDMGGLRATARDNELTGGTVKYGELSVEKFGGLPLGDMRLRLPSNNNSFQFIYGERGSKNIVAKLTDKGFFLPKVANVAEIPQPEKAQLVYDSTENQLKVFNGTGWLPLTVSAADNRKTGRSALSASGNLLSYYIPHGLSAMPSYFNVLAGSRDAANISFVTADANYLVIHYTLPPPAGTDNLSYTWEVKL
jgi:hypothetical protein